jgi:hypothetical protein
MSILMPVLTRARRQAKAVVCMTSLKQWGIIFSKYTEDNNGYFSSGKIPNVKGWNRGEWIIALREYRELRDREVKIRFCPMARKINTMMAQGGTFLAWQWAGDHGIADYGSYGLNSWVYNAAEGVDSIQGRPTEYNWRTINIKGGNKIPLFLDSWWVGGGPSHEDLPPQRSNPETGWGHEQEMRHYCIDRHDGTINGLFMDMTVRKIGLKELWKLKWHRQFDTNAPSPEWPKWMKRFKDY